MLVCHSEPHTRDADRLSRVTSQLIALLHRFRFYGVQVEFVNGSAEGRLRIAVDALL
jgi:hypothetical protein